MYLLKVAYLGWYFHGSQIQPNVKTVEGELFKVLRNRGRFLSRTDAGVSALGNVFVYRHELPEIGAINSKLLGIKIWASAEVDNVPKVKERIYRYFLIGKFDGVEKLKRFEGEHDFAGLTKDKRNTRARIEGIEIEKREFGYVIEFRAKRFLWNQIRRIVGTLLGRTAPPEPLILIDIKFEKEPEWKYYPKWLAEISREYEKMLAKAIILGELRKKSEEIAHH